MRRIGLLLAGLLVLAAAAPAGAEPPPAPAANEPRVLFSALVRGPHTIRGAGSDLDVWSVRSDGTGMVRLSTSGGTKGVPIPSPDGLQVAWTVGIQGGPHGIEVGSVLGGPTRLLPDEVDGSIAGWSQQGDRVAYDSGNRVRVMEVATGVARTAFTSPKGDVYGLSWSGVSEHVAAVSHQWIDSSLYTSHLWLGDAGGTGWRELAITGFNGDVPMWDPGQDRFVVVTSGRLTVVSGDGAVNRLAIEGSPAGWSHDGRIHYTTPAGQARWVRPDGTDDQPYLGRRGTWSQDGAKVAYTEGEETYVADADGTDAQRMPDATSQGATRARTWFGGFVPTAFGSTTRVAGVDRVSTAVEASRRAFTSAGSVVLARKDLYADALAAAPLTGGTGPVLLTDRDRLPAAVEAELARLDAGRALLMGTADAIGPGVESRLRALGLTVERVGGSDRFATAAAVAARLPAARHGWLVKGFDPDPARGWEDAVAVSAVAAAAREPVLLTTTGALPGATASALDGLDSVTIVGGTSAVSAAVEREVATHVSVDRVAGADRYATAVAVAGSAQAASLDASTAWLASGSSWPDAVTAGPAAAAGRAVLLLVDRDALERSAATRSWLTSATRVRSAVLAGGVASVGLVPARQVRAILDPREN